jgi:hypothetical protein
VTVNNRGVVTMIVRGEAGTRGLATLTANIRRASATRVRNVGRRSFRIGARRRATVRLRLTRPAISQLRRNRRLPVRARVVLTNAAGLRSPAATARFRITQRRR